MKKNLCLVSIEPVSLTDKSTGEKNTRFKYIFLTEKDEALVGWSDDRIEGLEPTGEDSFNRARAREFECKLDSFNGKLTSKVVLEA